MMSNPPSSLQPQQRLQHRRQNSTPIVAFEAMKVSNPTSSTRRPTSHRRGQSLDQRSPIRRQQPGSSVSIANLGSTPHGQQILREAQQQRLARPGQQQVEIPVSPQCGTYPAASHSIPGPPFGDNMTMSAMMQSAQGMQIAHPHYYHDMHMPLSAGLNGIELGLDENNQQYFQHVHSANQHMSMMEEKRISQPGLRINTGMRPLTPSQQVQTAHFPLTPATTPFRQHHPQSLQYSRSLQASPSRRYSEDIQAPYPISMQKSRSLQGIVEHEESKIVSQMFTPVNHGNAFEAAEIPVPSNFTTATEPTKKMQAHERSHSQPAPEFFSSQPFGDHSEDEPLEFFDETGGEAPELDEEQVPNLSPSRGPAGSLSPSRPALSPRRMSISDLNLEPGINASIEETNVTLDDIAQFIDGPDPVDNKWVCNFDGCHKRFGRKENIKSHVQTHLGDRQFRCDHCKKCFVRGHDLKRHAKIHTGTKPYPCLCGNSFARHDALTRHRQRGMCIGAFDGVVKKVIKRGRPRKHRPEMDDRVDKASRTRQANEYSDQYASSASSCSISSWGSPPTEIMESLSMRGQSPFDEMNLFGVPQQIVNLDGVALPPDMFSFTPPASPGYSTGNRPSPSYRDLSPADLAEMSSMPLHSMQMMPDLPMMAHARLTGNSMVIGHSQQSLPSLSHSSSSPAADVVAFDFSDDPIHAAQRMSLKMEEDRNDFDNFLEYGNMEMGLDTSGADSFFTNM